MMILPFCGAFARPFYCSLVDKTRQYRNFIIYASLAFILGFGGWLIVPLNPSLVKNHGRIAWYMLVVLTIIGYLALSVHVSLSDTYASNVSHRTGESFGMIKFWGTIGYGAAGAAGQLLATWIHLPDMVLGLILAVSSMILLVFIIWLWPYDEDFQMGELKEKPVKAAIIEASLPDMKEEKLSSTTTPSSINVFKQNKNQLKADQSSISIEPSATIILSEEFQRKRVAELQTKIFKMVVMKHKSMIKYMLLFFPMGAVYSIHMYFFFQHLDQIAQEGKGDFATMMGACLISQAVGEAVCFAIAAWVVRKLGRDGTLSLIIFTFVLRYYCNCYLIDLLSPYIAILTELLEGINYGVFYYVIAETALEYALKVDTIIPDLINAKLIDETYDMNMVKTSLRATMQGIFLGIYDGVGLGVGSILAGLYLENHTYEDLWFLIASMSLVVFISHAFYEVVAYLVRGKNNIRKEFDNGSIVV